VVTNAGFESVCAGDLVVAPLAPTTLDHATTQRLSELLASEGLGGLVTPRLPLDLTPMASESAYLTAVKLLMDTDAGIVIVGLVPFTRRLGTGAPEAAGFAQAIAALANHHQKAVGVVVDAGSEYEHYRRAFAEAGLPLFTRTEDAIDGLRALDTTSRAADHAVAF
jgi:acyl-CoA synthetase (NDP forming)